MNEKKISDLIYDWLDYMYCDNCRYDSELRDDGYGGNPCECCHRKENGWGVSRATANILAKKIIDIKYDFLRLRWKIDYETSILEDRK